REVDLHEVVDLNAGQLLHSLDQQVGSVPVFEGGVDLVEPVARDVHPQVPGDRQHHGPVPDRVDVHQDDGVGPLPGHDLRVPELALLACGQAGPAVAAEDQ